MSPAVSLNKAKESMFLQSDLELSKNHYQQFTFSKRFERVVLSSGFEQRAPSMLVTTLNVTKIAPVIFFVVEKLSKALETLLNASVYLLASAYSALFDSREIAVLDIHKEIEEIPDFLPSTIEMAAISFEEPAQPSSAKSFSLDIAPQISTGAPAEDNRANATIQEGLAQNPQSLDKDANHASGALASTDTVAAKISIPHAVLEDDLDAYQDLAKADQNQPALPPAPSHKTRNALIGGSLITLASAVVYGVAYHFNFLPDNINFIDNNKDGEIVDNENSESSGEISNNEETRELEDREEELEEGFNYLQIGGGILFSTLALIGGAKLLKAQPGSFSLFKKREGKEEEKQLDSEKLEGKKEEKQLDSEKLEGKEEEKQLEKEEDKTKFNTNEKELRDQITEFIMTHPQTSGQSSVSKPGQSSDFELNEEEGKESQLPFGPSQQGAENSSYLPGFISRLWTRDSAPSSPTEVSENKRKDPVSPDELIREYEMQESKVQYINGQKTYIVDDTEIPVSE